MSKRKQVETPEVTPEVTTPAAEIVAEVAAPVEVAPVAKQRGRPKGSKNSPKVAPVTAKLAFANGKLSADNGAEFVNGGWTLGGYNAENAQAELLAAQESANTLAAIVAKLSALPASVDPAALLAAHADNESVYAALDYLKSTR